MHQVIEGLLRGDRAGGRHAILTLLSSGPLLGGDVLLRAVRDGIPDDELFLIAGEITAFLQDVVRRRNRGYFSQVIETHSRIGFSAIAAGPGVGCQADGNLRDVVVLQLVGLMMQVGVERLRVCEATLHGFPCGRLWVKRWRREYCSTTCQKRMEKRRNRQRDAEEEDAWDN